MVSIFLIQLITNGEIDAFIIKKFCQIQNDICMQNKVNAEQYHLQDIDKNVMWSVLPRISLTV